MAEETPISANESRGHFIQQFIEGDLAEGRNGGAVVTRFPPEPNGYLHIGHAKAICIDFGMAQLFNGECHLRMDDTNPSKEDEDYVRSIKEDVRWLGFDWGDGFYYASDLFDRLFAFAEELIRRGHAYVCQLSQEEWKQYRGIPTEPGTPSPYRDRTPEENLALFHRMRDGEFAEGTCCLRAKIDMSSPNIHFRDPVIYRIMKEPHYRMGDKWVVYPMYDFAHPFEDAAEGVTHSLCTLEFEVHRPLYDWVIDRMDECGLLLEKNGEKIRPQQREFARLSLDYTVMSKRKLLQLVKDGLVDGWDDPRMPTVSGLRRRGYPAESIRDFCDRIGVSKYKSATEIALLESCVRDNLNKTALRRMGVLNPVKVVIDNFPEGETIYFDAVNNPEDESAGTRKVPFSRELWIEREDFMEDPPKKFFRLAPGREVRLRYACFFLCTSVEKDENGNITVIHGTWDPESKGGNSPDGRKVKGTIHWVSAKDAIEVKTRLYDRLFTVPNPEADEEKPFTDFLNPDSLVEATAYCEPSIAELSAGDRIQLERLAYFTLDSKLTTPGAPVLNRTVTLKDSK